jgi:UDP-N-acetylmuramoylalanine--D-glutamate ligase
MTSAVDVAAAAAGSGDIVALCPACASFGMFRNEFDRGEQFRQAVEALATNIHRKPGSPL